MQNCAFLCVVARPNICSRIFCVCLKIPVFTRLLIYVCARIYSCRSATSDPINLAVLITRLRRLYASAAQRMNANDIFSLNCSRRPSPWDAEPSNQYWRPWCDLVAPSWRCDAVATIYSTEQRVDLVWSFAVRIHTHAQKDHCACGFAMPVFFLCSKYFL